MKPSCSIVIRAFNEGEHLGRLLEGITHQAIKNVQVILVDSGSTDQTVEIAEQNGAEILHIKPEDFTFGRSLNVGIYAASSEFVLIASAHVYPVYPNWIEHMLDPFKDPSVALVCGKQRGIPASHFSERQIFNHWYPNISQNPQAHPFCNNANAAIRKKLWEQNAYDESLPGLEDLAWAKWAQENNYKIAYIASAEIKHVHEESWRGIKKRYLREGMAFKTIYPQEKFTVIDFLRLFFENTCIDLLQAKKEHAFFKECGGIIKFRWLQFWGTYLGYHRSGPLTWQLKQSFYYPRHTESQENEDSQKNVAPIEYE